MNPLKRGLKNLAIATTGSRSAQRILGRVAGYAEYLAGIGAGSEVETSGERAVFSLLRQRVSGSCIVFDVGANLGQFLGATLAAFPDGRCDVHCFEPGVGTFRRLSERYGTAANVRLNNVAVGKERGEATLWYDQEGSGIASLTKRDLAHFGVRFDSSETVKTTTLDAYCVEHSIPRIDLLKLDIEGHELDALNGAAELFRRHAIGMVMFEFGGCNIDTRTFFRDFWHFFKDAKMQLYRITPGGYLDLLSHYAESLEQFRTTNFLAVAPAAWHDGAGHNDGSRGE
jgi:FkbM family methyltransferase